MATFLQLCSKFSLRSGIVPAAPTTVVGQTGRKGNVVDWIASAWELIQNSNPDWHFLKAEWEDALTIGETTYTAADFGISERFAMWIGDRISGRRFFQPVTIYDPAIGKADEGPLLQIAYEQWRTSYDRGTHDANRPLEYCFGPDGTIRFGPKPDKAYTVRGEYRLSPQVLAADEDEPDMPARFHDIIVWRGIMLASEQDEAPDGLVGAMRKYAQLLYDLQRDQLPEITIGGEDPIA